MKQALYAAKNTAKFSIGLGMSITFVTTCDDMIYSTFRKNIIMPFQMVTIKGSTGTIEVDDVKNMASGTQNFIRDIKPRAIFTTNAKELMLKDADYSTP